MKKIIILLLCMALILPCAGVFTSAEGSLPHKAYTDSGQCGEDMFFELDKETGVLTITKTGDGDGRMYFPEDGSITIHMWWPDLVKKMVLPEGLTTLIIPEGSKNITEIEFPSTLEKIVADEIWPNNYLESLTTLKIPKNLSSISDVILATLESVKTVEVDPENRYFTYDGHALYSKDMKTLYHVFKAPDVFEIPSTVTSITAYSFRYCNTIKKLTLPEGIRIIPQGMFSGFKDLESVVVKGAQYIDASAFSRCTSLKYVELPDSLKVIHEYAFAECPLLTSVVIPDGIEQLNKKAFLSYNEIDGRIYYVKDLLFRGTEDKWKKSLTSGLNQQDVSEFDTVSVHFNWKLSDVRAGEWYVHGIAQCVDKGIMTGTGETTFSPDMILTRAQVVQILARALGADLDSYIPSGKFSDVPKDAWYAKAVEWAVENDVTGGTGEGCFSPDDPVTREQLMTFLYAAFGNDEPATVPLTAYTDAGEISDWALTPVRWGLRFGLMSGTSKTTLSPKSSATRAQTALIVEKSLKMVEK